MRNSHCGCFCWCGSVDEERDGGRLWCEAVVFWLGPAVLGEKVTERRVGEDGVDVSLSVASTMVFKVGLEGVGFYRRKLSARSS